MPIKAMATDEERWGEVPGYPNYQASTFGRIWSKKLNRPMKFETTKCGHKRIGLHKKRKIYKFFVHRLVLLTFLGPCPPGLETAHYDGNPNNNRFDNLLYTTRSKNALMANRHGTMRCGERHHKTTLTEREIFSIRDEYSFGVAGFGAPTLAKKYNVDAKTITRIVKNETWKHSTRSEAL